MTNFEFYKEKILKMFDEEERGAMEVILKLLHAEHIEKPKLTKAERAFCEVAQGFLGRTPEGILYLFNKKPVKKNDWWTSPVMNFTSTNGFFNIKFDFIKAEDEEPWSIEELLKLEVEE